MLTDELQAANVLLLCVSHPVEYGLEEMLFFQMRGVIAEYEREKTLERMRRGQIGCVKSGYPGGGAVPLGYRYIAEPHKVRFELDDEEAAVVRRIFTMYLDAIPARGIAHQLTQERIFSKLDRHHTAGRKQSQQGVWHEQGVHQILCNETYVGTMHWNKRGRMTQIRMQTRDRVRMQTRDRAEWIPVPVPAIIPQEIFDAARQKRASNRILSKRNRKHEYLFVGGKLRCGRCGASMISYVANNTPRYRCYSQIRYLPDEPFCRGMLRADAVEPATWREIERVRSDPDIILTELERREQRGVATQQDIKKERRAIQKALASLEREAQRWDEAYAEEVIDLGEFKAKKRDISERKQRLLTQQDGVWTATRSAQQYQAKTRDILTYCLRVKDQLGVLDTPHKRQALEALDIRVAWSPGEPLRIDGSIPINVTGSNTLSRVVCP